MSVFKVTVGTPLRLPFSGLEVKNRIERSAMLDRTGTWDVNDRESCGIPTESSIKLFDRLGRGEPGIIITGSTSPDMDHIASSGSYIIAPHHQTSGLRFERFQQLATAAKGHGSRVFCQLNHTGRQTKIYYTSSPVSASAVQIKQPNDLHLIAGVPHAATSEEIGAIKEAFVHGAEFLDAAGFEGVQINSAHGYLLTQFLSPLTNQRTDNYGGPLENRARLLLEIVRGIRARCKPSFSISVKLNALEYTPYNVQVADLQQLCTWLEDAKTDIVELSGGSYEALGWKHAPGLTTPSREGYYLDVADQLRTVLKKTLLFSSGGFYNVTAMNAALQTVDGVGMARGIAAEPDLPKKAIAGQSMGRAATLVPDEDYITGAMVAGAQMRQMSKGQEPMDTGKPEIMDEFRAKLKLYLAKSAADPSQSQHMDMDEFVIDKA